MNFIMKTVLKITRRNQLKRVSDTLGLIEQIRMKQPIQTSQEFSMFLDNLYVDLKVRINRFNDDEDYIMENSEIIDLGCNRLKIKQEMENYS